MNVVTLPDGREVVMGVRHGERLMDHLSRRKSQPPTEKPHRTVTVQLTIKNGEQVLSTLEGVANCSPHDNFDRELGRKMALKRALAQDEGHLILDRQARRQIVERLFPAMSLSGVKPKKAQTRAAKGGQSKP